MKAGFPTNAEYDVSIYVYLITKRRIITYIHSKVPNGREENLDVGACDELGVHSSGIFKKSTSKQ